MPPTQVVRPLAILWLILAAVSPAIATAGSPGTARIRKKTTSETARRMNGTRSSRRTR